MKNTIFVCTKKKLKCIYDKYVRKGQPHKPALPSGTILQVIYWPSSPIYLFSAFWPEHLRTEDYNWFAEANDETYILHKEDVEFIKPIKLLCINSVNVTYPSSSGTGAIEQWILDINYCDYNSDTYRQAVMTLALTGLPPDYFRKELEKQLQSYNIFNVKDATKLVMQALRLHKIIN